MIDDAALDRNVERWLKAADAGQMSSASLDNALTRARSISQRGSFALAVVGPTPWPARGRTTRPLAQWVGAGLGAAAIVVASVVAINSFLPRNGLGPLPAASASASPTASPSAPPIAATPTPLSTATATAPPSSASPPATGTPHRPTPSPAAPVAVEDQGPDTIPTVPFKGYNVPGGVLLTSRVFGLPITFSARRTSSSPENSYVCSAVTTERSIVMPDKFACLRELRILWPSEIDCGPLPVDLTVDGFANAVLANNTGLDAQDLGALEDLPGLQTTFEQPSTGRVIFIPGTTSGVDHHAINPNDCVIQSGDTYDELRADLYTRLILLDVDGRLVIVRESAGHDQPSAEVARDRGYTEGLPLSDLQLLSFGN